LGDSFDDLTAVDALQEDLKLWLVRLQASRTWVWIEGNHDAGPIALGGAHRASVSIAGLCFRHIATDTTLPEVSGHYHPKHRLAGRNRPAFLCDGGRLIMPAYGIYTGGLDSGSPALRRLFANAPLAILTGNKALAVPTSQP
jgi:metallophosphoesterase superfamily enzyme